MSKIITADQTELYFKDWGTGQPVILIHGWPLSSDSWDDQAMALALAGYRAIAYDRRGFGRSTKPWSGYDYDTLADDLAGFFEKLFAVTVESQPVCPQLLEWARSVSMQPSLKATLDCAKSFTTTDFRGELATFKEPTLIIHGTDDQIVPIDASSRLTAKGIAQSTLLEYDGAPHGLFATHKERLTTDLLDFLKR
jgi:pimeloyl-ACP methyl ester carboxylesterase